MTQEPEKRQELDAMMKRLGLLGIEGKEPRPGGPGGERGEAKAEEGRPSPQPSPGKAQADELKDFLRHLDSLEKNGAKKVRELSREDDSVMARLERLDDDLPSFGGIHRSPGILCLTLAREGIPQPGIRVSIKKGRQIIASDITTTDGKVCFKLLNGTYDCTAVDRAQEMYTFMVDFNDRYAESVIEIGG